MAQEGGRENSWGAVIFWTLIVFGCPVTSSPFSPCLHYFSIFQHLACFLAFLSSLMAPPPSPPMMRSLWFRTRRVLPIFKFAWFNS